MYRFLLRIVSLCKVINLVSMVPPSCIVGNIQAQQNFDISRYIGRWHEIYYQEKSYYGPADTWEDYTETYTLMADGNLHLVGQGRTPSERNESCQTLYSGTLLQTEESGKLNRTSGKFHSPLWILDTDYTNFSLTYGCRELDPQGGCTTKDKLDLWVWSRHPTLSQDQIAHVRDMLRDICVSFSELTATPIHRDCGVSVAIGK